MYTWELTHTATYYYPPIVAERILLKVAFVLSWSTVLDYPDNPM